MKKKKSSQKKENAIHIMLSYPEAKRGKIDLLSSELALLKISRNIFNYKKNRYDEFSKKLLIAKRMKEVRLNINKIKNLLPHLKIPELLKEKEGLVEKVEEEAITKTKMKPLVRGNVEGQLQEIQERLNQLQGA